MSFTSPQTYADLLVAVMMLALPGVALVMAIRRLIDKRPAKILSALLPGTALSIGVWPLLLLYISLVGLRFTPWLLWLVLFAAAAFILYDAWAQRAESQRGSAKETGPDASQEPEDHPRTAFHASPRLMHHVSLVTRLSLLALTLIYLAFRLNDIAGLDVPMFGDSLHHTMITSLIVDSGRVPTGYLPYVPVETFTYHFGFHTLAAVFAMLTGSTPQYAVLLLGQVLNALSVPLAYMLNRTLFASRLAGMGAALLTAAVSLMPAFYVNWGRYTQLSGQLLLMLALVSLVRVMRPAARWGDFALLALSAGGLVVVHYRILIFFGLFAVALGAWQLVGQWGSKWRNVLTVWARSIAAMALGLVLALPWVVNLSVNYVRGLVERLGTVSADYLAVYNDPNTLPFYIGRILPAIALVGFAAGIAGLWRFRRNAEQPPGDDDEEEESGGKAAPLLPPHAACLVLALWVALLVASLWIVPGAIGSYTVAITLYIPLSALGGYGIRAACRLVEPLLRAPGWVFAPLMVVAAPLLALLLGTAHVGDAATYNYLQKQDEQAFNWISANVPPGAKFLISSEFSYRGRAVTATDGGMWLPLLTGRNVSVPALNAWMERPIESDFFTRTRQLAAYTQPMTETEPNAALALADLVRRKIIPAERSLSSSETLNLMRQLGVTHVYVGALGGRSRPRLNVVEMRKDTAHYRLLYFKDGVYVFEVIY